MAEAQQLQARRRGCGPLDSVSVMLGARSAWCQVLCFAAVPKSFATPACRLT